MRAPSKAHNNQLVKIQSLQSLANSSEPNPTFVEVTKQAKLGGGMYQAETQVNVLSSVIVNVVEVDGIHKRGRQNHSARNRRELFDSTGVLGIGMIQDGGCVNLGDPLNSSETKSLKCIKTSQKRQGLMEHSMEVGLVDSTRSVGKPCTWGSDQQRRNGFNTSLSGTPRSGSK